MKLIRNARIYDRGQQSLSDILIVAGKIAAIEDKISLQGVDCEEFDAGGRLVTPGLIDLHVHTIGGGGQTGFASLAPEVKVSSLVKCGTTTVVGTLGTDGFVKTLPQLYAKTMSLRANNISAYMLTGFYGLPTPTITDCIANDLIFVDPVIGCKIAICDDRSSFPTELELLRIINQVRLGGFTSSKGGIMHIHLGALSDGMDLLMSIAKQYPSLISYISPTHTIRTETLFNQAIDFAKMGGMIDVSTGGTKFMEPYKVIMYALERGAPMGSMTFSSDGNGGVRKVDPEKGIDTYSLAPLDGNLAQTVKLITDGGLSPAEAFKLTTENAAKTIKVKTKGFVKVGYDADLCLFDSDYKLTDVISQGEFMMRDAAVVRIGNFEQ